MGVGGKRSRAGMENVSMFSSSIKNQLIPCTTRSKSCHLSLFPDLCDGKGDQVWEHEE